MMRYLLIATLLTCCPGLAARVQNIEIEHRELLPAYIYEGLPVPAYEKISGTVRYAFDPGNANNQRITDLSLAPRNSQGDVEARGNFMLLAPLEKPAKSVLLEVSNRGGKAALRYFNQATERTLDPSSQAALGSGLLQRQGLAIAWVGWQFDVPRSDPHRLAINLPVIHDQGQTVIGLARSDWVLDQPVAQLPVGHRGHHAYPPVLDADDHQLTRRVGREGPREILPREQWDFSCADAQWLIGRRDGQAFAPGFIYELVYRAYDPVPVGLGLAAIRDFMSYLKFDPQAPIHPQHGIGFGVSQTGRFLRHFLYQGFNEDEQGRKVFDGLLVHTAGAGRGSFNHRFGQPSRDAHRYSAFFYPTDLFPFTSRPTSDPVISGPPAGLSGQHRDPSNWPKVFYTNTGYEYWGRAAGLIHTTADGLLDVQPLASERIYHFASGQHFVVNFPDQETPPVPGQHGWMGSPVDFLVHLRALLVRLKEWVEEGQPPPASRYPRIADQTLVLPHRLQLPAIDGFKAPRLPHLAYAADYGPRWQQGIIDHQPPRLRRAYPSLVPQLDVIGNELGGIRPLEIQVPLASYFSWNLRYGLSQADELADFFGQYLPLAAQRKQRPISDLRPAIDQLYRDRADYRFRVQSALHRLTDQGLILTEEHARIMQRSLDQWQRVTEGPDRMLPERVPATGTSH